MVELNKPAPNFALSDEQGNLRSLADYKGKKVVLYFYPKDNTSGCTVEAKEFRDAYDEIIAKNAIVLGVSPDSQVSHQKFIAKHGLPFPLLVDADHKVADAYGVWGKKQMYGREYEGIRRTTFIIDENGDIARIFEKVKPLGHARQILEAL